MVCNLPGQKLDEEMVEVDLRRGLYGNDQKPVGDVNMRFSGFPG